MSNEGGGEDTERSPMYPARSSALNKPRYALFVTRAEMMEKKRVSLFYDFNGHF